MDNMDNQKKPTFFERVWKEFTYGEHFYAEHFAFCKICDVLGVPIGELTAYQLLLVIKILAELHHRDDGEETPDITDYL